MLVFVFAGKDRKPVIGPTLNLPQTFTALCTFPLLSISARIAAHPPALVPTTETLLPLLLRSVTSLRSLLSLGAKFSPSCQ